MTRRSSGNDGKLPAQEYRKKLAELSSELIALLVQQRYPPGWGEIVATLRALQSDVLWGVGVVRIDEVKREERREVEDILESLKRRNENG